VPLVDPATFVALRHRNFRLLWLGQLVSMSGTSMQTAALLWHVSLLAPPGWKALALGMVGLARLAPILVFGLLSGLLADVVERRRLMLWGQIVMMLAAATLALVTAGGLASILVILCVAGVGTAASGATAPARQALIPNLVPREHWPNAIALSSIVSQTASVVGPALAGAALALAGPAAVYALNAVSFLAVIAALLLMRGIPPIPPAERGAVSLRALGEGARFVFGAPLLRSTLLLDGLATFFCSATALLPIFAQDLLQLGAREYGWLYAAPSVGAVVASLAMVRFADRIGQRGVVLLWAVAIYGMATVIFGLSRAFWLTFLALAVSGAADTVSAVLRNIVRQTETPDRLRGRMIGISMVFFMGGPQLGEFESGVAAQWLGAGIAVTAGGVASVLTTAWIAWRTPALRAYRRGR
jgi:MFS family permease